MREEKNCWKPILFAEQNQEKPKPTTQFFSDLQKKKNNYYVINCLIMLFVYILLYYILNVMYVTGELLISNISASK